MGPAGAAQGAWQQGGAGGSHTASEGDFLQHIQPGTGCSPFWGLSVFGAQPPGGRHPQAASLNPRVTFAKVHARLQPVLLKHRAFMVMSCFIAQSVKTF